MHFGIPAGVLKRTFITLAIWVLLHLDAVAQVSFSPLAKIPGVTNSVFTNSFINFETPPIHPIAVSPDLATLAAVNLPDGRLDLFDIRSGQPVPIGSIPVGIDPVSVRFRSTNEVWVVNHISDSVSIIRLPALRVEATLATGDGPCDVAFAGSPQQAFVSCAQSNVVQQFQFVASMKPNLVRSIPIDGDRPKAMAVSPDGNLVYVAIFESGNGSTILAGDVASLNTFPPATAVDFPDGPHEGENPPPNQGPSFSPAINPEISPTNRPPRVGLIVRKNDDGRWMDDNQGDWTEYISGTNAFFTGRPKGWDVSDQDLAIIDVRKQGVQYVRRLMNICMDVAVNPATQQISVIGTEALNEVRFEPILNGIFVQSKLAIVSADTSTKTIKDLNPHLDYKKLEIPSAQKARSIGDPRGIVWNSSGTRAYVAGMGSGNVVVFDGNGNPVEPNPAIKVGDGPVGLALDESRNRLYVLNRFADSISVIDTSNLSVIATVPMYDPTPKAIKAGRKHLYDTQETSGLGQVSCASCHVDGRFDRLAWDLGAPNGTMQIVTTNNHNFARFPPPPGERHDYHPMKGPMVTQTLQDIIGHEPFHWRGDRDGIEAFNGTYTNLQAAASALTTNQMQELKSFLATIAFPPNPYRTMSNTLPSSIRLTNFMTLGHGERFTVSALGDGIPSIGLSRFRQQGGSGCSHCHTLPTGLGPHMNFVVPRWRDLPLGTNGEFHVAVIGLRRSNLLPFKIPSLRNFADKVGMSFQKTMSRSGFGFTHDGSMDSPVRFLQESLLLSTDQDAAHMIAFLLCLSGSDLPEGSLTDQDRPIGVRSLDAHAAVGVQWTSTNNVRTPPLSQIYGLFNSPTSRIELIVKGYKDGVPRGWLYDPPRKRFISDRTDQFDTPTAVDGLASIQNPVTYTIVQSGTGRRLGIDQDEDGYPDRTELDAGSNPANPNSIPITLLRISNDLGGIQFSWKSVPGKDYRIQYKNSLQDSEWQDLGVHISADGAVTQLKDPNSSNGTKERYYRILSLDE